MLLYRSESRQALPRVDRSLPGLGSDELDGSQSIAEDDVRRRRGQVKPFTVDEVLVSDGFRQC